MFIHVFWPIVWYLLLTSVSVSLYASSGSLPHSIASSCLAGFYVVLLMALNKVLNCLNSLNCLMKIPIDASVCTTGWPCVCSWDVRGGRRLRGDRSVRSIRSSNTSHGHVDGTQPRQRLIPAHRVRPAPRLRHLQQRTHSRYVVLECRPLPMLSRGFSRSSSSILGIPMMFSRCYT